MQRATVLGGACALVLVLLGVAVIVGHRSPDREPPAAAATLPVIPPSLPPAASHQGFLYGRVSTVDGASYEGRLRFGGDQEAFWDDAFNGTKRENPWLALVPPERLRKESRAFKIFGFRLGERKRPVEVDRPFVARFGDLARVEVRGREVRVTLKSGTAFDLDRLGASDFDDGVRVWDVRRGAVDLDSLRIRSIELLPTGPLGTAPARLYGTVYTRQGDFTGFLQWNRWACVGADELRGRSADGVVRLHFDTLRSIARRSRNSSRVTLRDGREMVLSGTSDVGEGHRGTLVEDSRFGRVLVSPAAFERVDLGDPGVAGSGPAYGDFPPGRPLAGRVTTRDGRRLAGRLVYDLDESETTETLDASARGVSYSLPFARIASVVLPDRRDLGDARARVTLLNGEALDLQLAGDLGEGNAGMLVFVDGRPRPEYVPWSEVSRIDLDRPPAEGLPLDGRAVPGAP